MEGAMAGQFDGSDDAPMAAGSLCSECGEIEKHSNHAPSNRRSHFFSSTSPVLDSKLPRLSVLTTKRTIEDLYGTPEDRKNRRQLKRAMKRRPSRLRVEAVRAGLSRSWRSRRRRTNRSAANCWKQRDKGFHRGRGSHTFEIEQNATCITIARLVEIALNKTAPDWLAVNALAVKPSNDQYEVTVLVSLPMSSRSRKRARKVS
jgi:hypothetical protein